MRVVSSRPDTSPAVYESVTVSADEKVARVVVASVSATRLYTVLPARFFPVGLPAVEKNVLPSSKCAWNVAELDVEVNDVGTVSVRRPSVSVPPAAVVIVPSPVDETEELPVQPVVRKVALELVAVFEAASTLSTL